MTTTVRLMGLTDIGQAIGVSKQRVDAITSQRSQNFPAPFASGRQGRVWRKDDVYRWAIEHGRPWNAAKMEES